jgi:hypothetical protein
LRSSQPTTLKLGNVYFTLSATDASGENAITQFSKPFTITLSYADTAVADPSQLGVYFFDTTQQKWVRLQTTAIDRVAMTISAQVAHLTEFALLGDPALVDSVAPTTTDASAGTAGDNGWYVSPVSVTLSATDNTVGSGVAQTLYAIDDAACTPSAPATCQVYVAPFTTSSDGAHTLTYFSRDVAGNMETLHTQSIQIDTTPPGPTTRSLSGGTAGQNGWYTTSPSITLASTDATSKLASITYQFVAHSAAAPSSHDSEWTAYTSAFAAPAGDMDLYAFSTDNAGNREAPINLGELKVDSTPPVTTSTVSGTHGNTGWYTSNVTVSLTATDAAGGSGVQSLTYSATGAQAIVSITVSGATATISLTTEGQTALTFAATDAAGNQEKPQQLQISLDKTPPGALCAQPDSLWHATDVVLNCTAVDGVSLLANPADANFSLSASVPAGTENASASTGSRQVCDVAGNCVTAGPLTSILVDKKAPTIIITAPTATTYTINQVVPASYTCTDNGSGVATCTVPVPNGSNLDTVSVGGKAFTVNAADRVGNTATQSATYQVAYKLCLLYDPAKAAQSGSTIPIKLYLCDAAGHDVSSSSVTMTAQNQVQVSSSISGQVLDAGNANPDNNFRYDSTLGPSGGYIFNLKTTGLTTGTYQLNFSVTGDPSPHSVQFQIK